MTFRYPGITPNLKCANIYNSFFSSCDAAPAPLLNAMGSPFCLLACGVCFESLYNATIASLAIAVTLAHAMPQTCMLMLPVGALGKARIHST